MQKLFFREQRSLKEQNYPYKEIFAADVESIESVGAIGAVFEQVFF